MDHSEQGFLLVRIDINITKLLIRVFKLKCEDDMIYPVTVKYERLRNYCYYCEKVDHEDIECAIKFDDKCKGKAMESIQRVRGLANGIRTDSPNGLHREQGMRFSAPPSFLQSVIKLCG